jgi:hypothetical protein
MGFYGTEHVATADDDPGEDDHDLVGRDDVAAGHGHPT